MKNKYEIYKKTDFDWIGYIPSDWDVSKIKKESIKNQRGNTPKYEENDDIKIYPILNQACVYNKYIKFEKQKFNTVPPKGLKGNLQLNDILLCSTGGGTAGRIGFWNYSFDNYIVDSHLTIIRMDKNIYSKYYYYLLLSSKFKDQIYACINGATNQEELSNVRLNEMPIIKPSLMEQTAIANYLDKKTSSIEDSIETLKSQKERLIEQKKAIIHKAVTKGLDDSVEMKDSGVYLLKEYPLDWNIGNLKEFFKFSMGNTILKEDLNTTKKGYPVYSATEKDKFFGYVNEINLTLNKNDIVIPARGNSIGYVKIVKQKSTTTQTTIAGISKNKINTFFAYYYLTGLKELIFVYDNTAIPQYTVQDANNIKIVFPELIEQNNIVKYLDKKTSKIDEAVSEVDKQIGLLNEYKKTLINDVVTGKVKVV